jgi:hypothetical protein
MTSAITTTNIDIQFPIPGQDNDTQGFRNNFGEIKSALDTAASEISDIQAIQEGIISNIAELSDPTKINADIVTATVINSGFIVNTGTFTNGGTLTSVNLVATNTISASGDITTTGRFVGDGSSLTNITVTGILSTSTQQAITQVGTLSNITMRFNDGTHGTTATLAVYDSAFLIQNVSNVVLTSTTASTTATWQNWGGAPVSGDKYNSLLLNTVSGIEIGHTFKFYATETRTHVVLGLSTITNIVNIPLVDASDISNNGVDPGSTVLTFNSGRLLNTTSYAHTRPATSKGRAGDKKGMIFAASDFIYVCYADFTNGASDIWSRSATTAATW